MRAANAPKAQMMAESEAEAGPETAVSGCLDTHSWRAPERALFDRHMLAVAIRTSAR